MYLPSGEYAGLKLPPALVEIFTGIAAGFARSSVHRSTCVEIAGIGSVFSSNVSSLLSGENAYASGPPTANGGTSCSSQGFRYSAAPPLNDCKNRCERVSPVNAFQCR